MNRFKLILIPTVLLLLISASSLPGCSHSQSHTEKGIKLSSRGYNELAIEEFNKAIADDSEDFKAYHYRGNAYAEQQNFYQASLDYAQAMNINPEYASVYTSNCHLHIVIGSYEMAISNCNQAIALDPEQANAYINRGNAYALLSNYETALADMDKAIELLPDYSLAFADRGWVYLQLGDYQLAIDDLNTSIDLNPKYFKAYFHRAEAFIQTNQIEQGLRDYDMVIVFTKDRKTEEEIWFNTQAHIQKVKNSNT